MLTYTSSSTTSVQQEPNAKPWLLLLLCFFWLIPGLVGHDPWKPFEAQATDIVWNFVRGQSWIVPKIVNTVYLEHHPLFFWTAASLYKLLPKGGVALHDIVRLTSGMFTGLAMWGVGLAGCEFYGRRFGRYAVLALMGSIGLAFWGHHASPHILSLAAFAWIIYALAWGQRRPLPAGLILGVALLMLFLGGTPREFILALLLIIGAVFYGWRYTNIIVMLGTALIIAVPVGLFWPLALKQTYPQVYVTWLKTLFMQEGILQPQPFSGLVYYLELLPWFSWPALPMALWSIWHNRHALQEKKWRMPIIFLVVTFIWLLWVMPGTNDYMALPILLPLALLAAGGIDAQRRGLASALNWFGMMTFGLSALALWLLWSAIYLGFPAKLSVRTMGFNPAYLPSYSYPIIGFAVFISVVWCWVLFRRRQLGKQAMINWTCGLALVWGLSMSLLLPWLDASKTYRYVAQDLHRAIPAHYQGCMASQGLNSAIEASFHYFAGIETQKIEEAPTAVCPLLVVQAAEDTYFAPPQAKLLWQGARQGEVKERFYLYHLP
jgi:4-amino-4-deoxy-L-arabinose transferase-like glycosyltransferase